MEGDEGGTGMSIDEHDLKNQISKLIIENNKLRYALRQIRKSDPAIVGEYWAIGVAVDALREVEGVAEEG